MPALRFDRVTKSFPRHTGQLLLRDRLARLLRGESMERFVALRDVSFAVEHGETVGIVGHNGAGKSTLLGVAAGLAPPNQGRVKADGRVAPLLELGSGFHFDLTGDENIRINASLLGLSRRQLRERYDDIVAFADIGEFVREPLRTYSSGMVMRLAFSVAAHVEPDILVVDEVLGVGDEGFMKKCVKRMLEFREQGKTILCASHSVSTLKMLCGRALWLDHGRLIEDGPIDQVLEAYHESVVTGTLPLSRSAMLAGGD